MREPHASADIDGVRDAVRQLVRGRSNAMGSVTLTANAGSTTVLAPFVVSIGSYVGLMPTTANAASIQPD